MSEEYNQGKIKPLIKIIVSIARQFPNLLNDNERFVEEIENEIPELKDKAHCANCGASMYQYVYNLNVIDVALIIGMAKAVRKAKMGAVGFTEANRVHCPTLQVSDAVRHKTTRCAKLGLIAKYLKNGKQVKGMWVITRRGFAALKGDEIPNGIIVWRGQTIERPDITTTFNQVRSRYKTKVEKNKQSKDNYHSEVMNYDQNEWIGFDKLHDGTLF